MSEIKNIMLPYPPSLNHYWRHCRGRTYIGKIGIQYRDKAIEAFRGSGAKMLSGELAVEITLQQPTMTRGTIKQKPRKFTRPMDLDNALKAMLDALQHAGAYANDGQIAKLTIERGVAVPGGMALVTIREIDQAGSGENQ